MSKMSPRLLLVSEHYPPTMGGVATSARRIARNLSEHGADVHLLTFDHSRPLESEDYYVHETDGLVDVRRYGPFFLKHSDPAAAHLPEKHRAILRRRAFNQMLRFGEEIAAEAVMSLYVLNAGFIAGLLANALGIPHIAGVRGNDVGRNIFDVNRFGVIAWVLQNAQRIACVNEHLRRRLLIAFPDRANVTVTIPNGVTCAEATTTAAARTHICRAAGWGDDDLIAVFIGTPREKKGVVPMLHAFAALPEDPPIRLLVVGPQISGVEQRIAGNVWTSLIKERRLHVTGLVDRSEVASWSAAGDVVLMPSLDDGMANGLLEGIALGLAPIVSPIFVDVIVAGETGIVLPEVTAASIAHALMAAAADRAALRRLGAAAKQMVEEKHSAASEAAAYIQLLNNVFLEKQT